jgi:hypothetical protein
MGGVMDLRDELIKAAGTHQRAARVLRMLEHDTAVALFDGGVAACPGDGCPGCPDCARPSSVPPELVEP